MADKITRTNQCVLDLTLSKNDDIKTRRITFDATSPAAIKDFLLDGFQDSLVGGGYSTFFQPTGWRDYDETDAEYTCTGLKAFIVSKTETELDLGD